MKRLILTVVFGVVFGTATFASTTSELKFTTGTGASAYVSIVTDGSTVPLVVSNCTDSGALNGCPTLGIDLNNAAGTITIIGTVDGWSITAVTGQSLSPNLNPFGLELHSLTATCLAPSPCTSNPLTVDYSDIGFTAPHPGGFVLNYATNDTAGTTTTESAWIGTNTQFTHSQLIGTIGPLGGGVQGGSLTGGNALSPSNPYSLTIEQVFNPNGGASSFSVDGSLTAVPEPTAVVLFGTTLVLCASGLRRRRNRA